MDTANLVSKFYARFSKAHVCRYVPVSRILIVNIRSIENIEHYIPTDEKFQVDISITLRMFVIRVWIQGAIIFSVNARDVRR